MVTIWWQSATVRDGYGLRLYHAINRFVSDHSWIGSWLGRRRELGRSGFAVATFALWLFARQAPAESGSSLARPRLPPPRSPNDQQLIAQVWHRARPFADHPLLRFGAAGRMIRPSPVTMRVLHSRSRSQSSSLTGS